MTLLRCLFIFVLFAILLVLPSMANPMDGECSSINSCSPNAVCKNATGTPTCSCKSGFTGDGYDCEDINECQSPDYRKCSGNAQCLNLLGSYNCTCNEGWVGDGFTCSDADECALGTDLCSANATCFNQIGTYACTCKPGYYGNGYFCYAIDYCKDASSNNCSKHATCHNTYPGFTCECNAGYIGNGYYCASIIAEDYISNVNEATNFKNKFTPASVPVIIGCTIAAAVFIVIAVAVGLTVRSRRRRSAYINDIVVKQDDQRRANEESNIGASVVDIRDTQSSGDSNPNTRTASPRVALPEKKQVDEGGIYSDPESYSEDSDSDTSDSGSESDPSEIETELSSSENKRVIKS